MKETSVLEHRPQVTIVVLNWNNAPDTIACLDSIYKLGYPAYQVLVVDNGSTDGSDQMIREAYPDVDFLQTGANLGYAEGNNVGIRHALQGNPDYLFVLNNDTLLANDMLDQLVQAAESDPGIVMTGPTMYCTDPPDILFAAGSFVNWKGGTIQHRGMLQPASQFSHICDNNPVDFIVGCGVLVKTSFIREAGVLDPDYYLNYEDVEWGIRAVKRGYQVVHVPSAVMWHKISAKLGLASPANTYYMTRNALLFFWRNLRGWQRWLTMLVILGRTLRTIAAWSVWKKYQTPTYQKKRAANLYALRDFLTHRSGEMGPAVKAVCYGK